ncbi:MarR family winged helix-turn-helix transcriptional regulator [Fulvivirgaceae bacterium BMA12]|uniref:MarR family winged helix-turn-helix transcriptional regulator n=1 Tax=Agaribacillus aureus TaxID=3051825 RepID=A0ABT8LE78_9BACT|nr:MarR family winged helix-turn-helix transcriptional regulator [Fulvivirgaceae bacterium BMA12]
MARENLKSPFNPHQQSVGLDHKIVVTLEKFAEVFRVLLWEQAKENRLSPIQLQILLFLNFHSADQRKVAYLAKEFNMTKATISDAVKSLINKEMIVKKVDKADTRSFFLNLTSAGKKATERTALFSGALQASIAELDGKEKENLFRSLFKVIQSLNQKGIVSLQRMCFSCRFYEGDRENKHFCQFLNLPLKGAELRVDCPEHEPS